MKNKSGSSNEDKDKKIIRNSTAEFLIFTAQAGEQGIEARYEEETIWLSQKLMAELFAVDVRTINEHLKNIFETGEVQPETTIRNFRIVQMEGARQVARNVDFYNLDAIISVGYRVNSVNAYLDLAEDRAKRNIPMTMEDWAKRLDTFLEFTERDILQDAGKVSAAEIAKTHAESEFEKYRIVQDRTFESDFDKVVKNLENPEQKKKGES